MEPDLMDPFRSENNVRVRDLVIKYGEANDEGRMGMALIEVAERFNEDYREPLGGICDLSVEKLMKKMAAVSTEEWVVERMGDGVDYVIVSVETIKKTREVAPDTTTAPRSGSAEARDTMQPRVTSCGVQYKFSPVKNEVVDRSMGDQQQIEEPVQDPVQNPVQNPVQDSVQESAEKPSGNSLLGELLSMLRTPPAVTSSPSVPCPTLTTPDLPTEYPFKAIVYEVVSDLGKAIRIAKDLQEQVKAANASGREAVATSWGYTKEAMAGWREEKRVAKEVKEGLQIEVIAANARAAEAETARANAEEGERKALQEVDLANARATEAEAARDKALQEVIAANALAAAAEAREKALLESWLASLSSLSISTPSRSSPDSISSFSP